VHLTRNEKVACSSQVTSSTKEPRNRDGSGVFTICMKRVEKVEIC